MTTDTLTTTALLVLQIPGGREGGTRGIMLCTLDTTSQGKLTLLVHNSPSVMHARWNICGIFALGV